MTQNGDTVYKKDLLIRTAQGTLEPMSRAIYCIADFVESSVVTLVCILLSYLCEIGPPLILNLSKLALDDAANETEGNPPHSTWRLSQVGLLRWSLLR